MLNMIIFGGIILVSVFLAIVCSILLLMAFLTSDYYYEYMMKTTFKRMRETFETKED